MTISIGADQRGRRRLTLRRLRQAKTSFSERVYQVVNKIPSGHTLTYKQVANLVGQPRAYRAVGNILNKNRDFKNIPCHRVIYSDGKIGGYALGVKKKKELLEKEISRHSEPARNL